MSSIALSMKFALLKRWMYCELWRPMSVWELSITFNSHLRGGERKEDGKIHAIPLDESIPPFVCEDNQLVSMNLFVFTKDIMEVLKARLPEFLKDNISNLKAEFLIPDEVSRVVGEGRATLELLETPSVWYGVTSREDKPSVVKALKRLTEKGLYKEGLY